MADEPTPGGEESVAPETAATEPRPEEAPDASEEGTSWENVGEDAPNRWEGMREATRAVRRGELDVPASEPGPEAETEPPDEGAPADREPEAELEEDDGTEQPDTEPDEDGDHERFTAIGPDGEEQTVEFEEGTEIRFKADGKEQTVSSMDELVDLAQQGVAFQRKSQEFAQTQRQLETQLDEVESAAEEQISKANRVIREILTDEEAFQHYRDQLDKLDDPEVQKRRQAERERDELKAEREEREKRQREQAVEEFTEALNSEVESGIEEREFLEPQDAELIQDQFLRLQERQYGELLPQYMDAREEQGWSEEEARQAAWAQAALVLTEENLTRVMDALDDEIRKRAGGRANGSRPSSEKESPDPEAEVKQHNRYTDTKLDQKERGSGLRSGGAPPGSSDTLPELERQEGETVFDARKRAMRQELDKARG